MKNNHQESESFNCTYEDTPEMFGHPYKELQDYFSRYPKRGTVLDLGCGQGRDSIFLASLGYKVTSVDSSKIGVEQMISKAKEQELKLNGIVADVLNLKLEEKFDVILFDMLLHSFEKQQQFELLKKYSPAFFSVCVRLFSRIRSRTENGWSFQSERKSFALPLRFDVLFFCFAIFILFSHSTT